MRGAMTSFNRIENAIKIYQDSVNYSLKRYGEKAKPIKEQTKEGFVDKHLAPLKEDARKEISAARKDLNKVLESERDELERLLREKMSVLPDKTFSDLLRFYRDFDIVPNKMEVSALLAATKDNALAIRALNGYLEKSESGYKVTVTSYDDFIADLDKITRMQWCLWTGTEYRNEATEIFKDVQRSDRDSNGKPYTNGWLWGSTPGALIGSTNTFNIFEKEIKMHSEAWSAELLPKIVEDEKGKTVQVPHDLPPVEDVANSAEEWAKRTGEEKAALNAKARETMELYTRH